MCQFKFSLVIIKGKNQIKFIFIIIKRAPHLKKISKEFFLYFKNTLFFDQNKYNTDD